VSAFSLISAPPSVSVRLHCTDYALLPLKRSEDLFNP